MKIFMNLLLTLIFIAKCDADDNCEKYEKPTIRLEPTQSDTQTIVTYNFNDYNNKTLSLLCIHKEYELTLTYADKFEKHFQQHTTYGKKCVYSKLTLDSSFNGCRIKCNLKPDIQLSAPDLKRFKEAVLILNYTGKTDPQSAIYEMWIWVASSINVVIFLTLGLLYLIQRRSNQRKQKILFGTVRETSLYDVPQDMRYFPKDPREASDPSEPHFYYSYGTSTKNYTERKKSVYAEPDQRSDKVETIILEDVKKD